MLFDDFLQQNEKQQILKNVKTIKITSKIVRFENSIYQFRNVTGFEIGELPKPKFPLQIFLILVVGGIVLLAVVVGIFLLGAAAYLLFRHFNQPKLYGLNLYFNSGQMTAFSSSDRRFLGEIVTRLYQVMDEQEEGFIINMHDRSINVLGNAQGALISGEENQISHSQF